RSARLHRDALSPRHAGRRCGVRRAEPPEGPAVHEAPGTRPGLSDVTLHRTGVGAGAPRGGREVSPVLRRVWLGGLLLAVSTSVWAHAGGSTGYASITISRSTVRYSLTLPISTLPSELAEVVRLAQTGSPLNREKLLDVIRTKVLLRAKATRCEPGPCQVLALAHDSTSFTMLADFACR